MAGRLNYQTAEYQCIRPGELWQCNWLEETGTICSLVYDAKQQTITTLLGFSKGTPHSLTKSTNKSDSMANTLQVTGKIPRKRMETSAIRVTLTDGEVLLRSARKQIVLCCQSRRRLRRNSLAQAISSRLMRSGQRCSRKSLMAISLSKKQKLLMIDSVRRRFLYLWRQACQRAPPTRVWLRGGRLL